MIDYVGSTWEELLPHVEDDLRQGEFEMQGYEYQPASVAWEQEFPATNDEYCWGDENHDAGGWTCAVCDFQAAEVVPMVVDLDEPLHADDKPYCDDLTCYCHGALAVYANLVEFYRDGLLSAEECDERIALL